jgi:hypothetical protein
MTSRRPRTLLLAAIVAPLLLGAGLFRWLKAEHMPTEAIGVAQTFVADLQLGQFAQAHALSTKGRHVGANPRELEAISRRQLCKAERLVGTHPYQSNGNRLRRWLAGTGVDLPEVRVELEGPSLLGVTVRHLQTGAWRVSEFNSHAG